MQKRNSGHILRTGSSHVREGLSVALGGLNPLYPLSSPLSQYDGQLGTHYGGGHAAVARVSRRIKCVAQEHTKKQTIV